MLDGVAVTVAGLTAATRCLNTLGNIAKEGAAHAAPRSIASAAGASKTKLNIEYASFIGQLW